MPRRKTATSFGAIRGNTPKPSHSPITADARLIRQRYREAAATTISYLRDVANGQQPDATHADRIKAADLLAKYGLGTHQEVEVAGTDGGPVQWVMVGGHKVGF